MQFFGFLNEAYRIEHNAIAHHVDGIFLEDAARNGTQYVLISVKMKRMTGIRAALEARHHIIIGGQYVYYFTLSFVSPLKTQQYIYLSHNSAYSKVLLFRFFAACLRANLQSLQ